MKSHRHRERTRYVIQYLESLPPHSRGKLVLALTINAVITIALDAAMVITAGRVAARAWRRRGERPSVVLRSAATPGVGMLACAVATHRGTRWVGVQLLDRRARQHLGISPPARSGGQHLHAERRAEPDPGLAVGEVQHVPAHVRQSGVRTGLVEALHTPGPAPEQADLLGLFGQFVGSWQLQWSGRDTSGQPAQMVGELHVGWVLGGRAVQDVWIVPGRGHPGEGRAPGFHGTTIRFYDPAIGAWHSIWIDPPNGRVRRFVARRAGDDIELLSEDERPHLRWRFTDITGESFLWIGEISTGHGAAWQHQQEMRASRLAS